MSRWRLPIRGDSSVLAALVEDLIESSLAIRQDKHGFHIASDLFDALDDAKAVKDAGDELVARLNGITRLTLQSRCPIECAGVARVRDDGILDQWVFPEPAVAYASVGRATVLVNGVSVSAGRRSRAQRWMALAAIHDGAARVLRLLGNELDWIAIYKIIEIVTAGCGGDDGVAGRGWASKAKLKLLKHTANSVGAVGDDARHGTDNSTPPRNPMPIGTARTLTRTLAEKWLDSLG